MWLSAVNSGAAGRVMSTLVHNSSSVQCWPQQQPAEMQSARHRPPRRCSPTPNTTLPALPAATSGQGGKSAARTRREETEWRAAVTVSHVIIGGAGGGAPVNGNVFLSLLAGCDPIFTALMDSQMCVLSSGGAGGGAGGDSLFLLSSGRGHKGLCRIWDNTTTHNCLVFIPDQTQYFVKLDKIGLH